MTTAGPTDRRPNQHGRNRRSLSTRPEEHR